MQKNENFDSFIKLTNYCQNNSYEGWDPYDGLNSKIFQTSPLKYSAFFRLAWIQFFKLSPVDLRRLLLVSKGYNAKGIGLFLSGYCNLFEILKNDCDAFSKEITLENCTKNIVFLADKLIELQSPGYSGACWGYNFDWQNRVFFQPKGTPTIVATSFISNSLFEAYEITKVEKYKKIALSSANFVLKDLYRTKKENGFIFSYSPLDKSCVYNASLLGSRLLAKCFHYTGNIEYRDLSLKSLFSVISKQNTDGSWVYGEATSQKWIDSFHTGFDLECIYEIMKYTSDQSCKDEFEKGMKFYLNNFFLENGIPKYYNNKIFPLDIHSPAQLIATLVKTNLFKENSEIANKVIDWTCKNMQSKKGFFFYQIKKMFSSKIAYMRWSQAWMFYAFSLYFKAIIIDSEKLDSEI